MTQVEKLLTVKNKLGLHARPAAMFVKITARFKAKCQVSKGDVEVNGKSLMGLMMLAAEQGSKVKVVLDGADAAQAMAELEKLFDEGFDE